MVQLTFHAKELSDLYALRTLYDYLKEDNTHFDIEFSGAVHTNRQKEILKGIPARAETTHHIGSIENLVTPFSDIGGKSIGMRNLEIDISILKNCAKPATPSDKEALREKYNVPSERPVLVISYASGTSNEIKLVDACKNLATIIIVGGFKRKELDLTFPELEGSQYIKCDNTHGALKDYYTLADASVNSQNFVDTKDEIHNFIEATEGGPLFMVPSSCSHQFGFEELARVRVIKKCLNENEIIERVAGYLKGWTGHDGLMNIRAKHIKATREKYLPFLHDYMKYYFLGERLPSYGLMLGTTLVKDVESGRHAARISHPDTNWGCSGLRLEEDYEDETMIEMMLEDLRETAYKAKDKVAGWAASTKGFALCAIHPIMPRIRKVKVSGSNEVPGNPWLDEFLYEHPMHAPLMDFEYNAAN